MVSKRTMKKNQWRHGPSVCGLTITAHQIALFQSLETKKVVIIVTLIVNGLVDSVSIVHNDVIEILGYQWHLTLLDWVHVVI
jgi:hypothetical protein